MSKALCIFIGIGSSTIFVFACSLSYLSEGGSVDGLEGGEDARVETAAEACVPPCSYPPDATPGRCQPNDAWGPPHEIVLPFSGSFYGVTLTGDENTLVYSFYAGSADLFRASRRAGTDIFEFPSLLTLNTTNENEFNPSISADRTLLVYSSSAQLGYQALRLRRNAIDGDAGVGDIIYSIDAGATLYQTPYLTPSARALYFGRFDDLTLNLYRASAEGASFGPPTLELPSVASWPVVSDDELTLFVARYDGSRYQTYELRRPSTATKWIDVSVVSVPPLVSALNTTPHWVSLDGCVLYYSVDGTKLRYVQRGEK